MAFRWLSSDEIQSGLRTSVRGMVNDAAAGFDSKEQSAALAARIRHGILSVPLSTLIYGLISWLRQGQNDRRLFGGLAGYFRSLAERPETREQLADLFERIREKKLQGAGLLMNLLAGVASAMDVINFDDLAECAQQEALRVLDAAEDENSAFGKRLREAFYARLYALGQDAAAQELFAEVRGELLRAIPLENVIEAGMSGIIGTLRSDLPSTGENELEITLDTLIDNEIKRWVTLLESDSDIGAALDSLIEDVVRRSALQAQIMSSAIVREVLRGMADKKLNAIVYEKVEPDLLWIRMNGSIVGAAVGFVFLPVQALQVFPCSAILRSVQVQPDIGVDDRSLHHTPPTRPRLPAASSS